jgi:hypothetical protein
VPAAGPRPTSQSLPHAARLLLRPLRAYAATLIRGEPHPHDHATLRWLTAPQLNEIDWVPADRGFLPALNRLLA